jgi:acyl-homoserine-lactone acylase
MKSFYYLIILAISVACTSQSGSELSKWKKQAKNVEIIRDDFGVPHIYGKTDADAVFGLLYSQCEDDFNRVERNYIWAIGRLAEVEGESALYSDLRTKLFMTEEEAIALYESSPEWLKKLCGAFADGINYYLHSHPEVKPKLITHFEPWMPMYFSEGSIGGDIERVSTRQIEEFYQDNEAGDLLAYHSDFFRSDDDEPRGSNGIAVSGKLTQSGNAMLLINPHTSFFFRGEVHMVSEEGLNAYGAVTWGQFFIYQGFNEKTGWMHTSTYTDVMDQFIEQVEKTDDGLIYHYGEEKKPVTQKEVTLSYLQDGKLLEKEFTIYRTHHGPITGSINGNWVATAMMWDPVNALIQSYIRTKKTGLKEFDEMMDIRTNSSNNTVYADAEGNIAYYHGNFIPIRDTQFDYNRPVDGSDPATDWKGLHPVDETIVVTNPGNGWIQNCNSTPFTCADEYSPKIEDYPYYMSANQENWRGIHAIRLLREAKNLTLDGLIALAYDPYIPPFQIVIPGLIYSYDKLQPKDGEIAEAIEILKSWDFAVSKESVAMSLATYYYEAYLSLGSWERQTSSMNRVYNLGEKITRQKDIEILRVAIDRLKRDFGRWDIPWGEINRYQRLNGDIVQNFSDEKPSLAIGMASGRVGALASFGARTYPGTVKRYGTSGNSFIAVVEFGDKVKAKSLLAGGQSGNPQSPHFDDQAQRYADVEFKDVAYYRVDVEARAVAIYKPGDHQ